MACFRVLPRPDRIAFRRHSWSFANRLASLEAPSHLATARFPSAGLLPHAVRLGFPGSFRFQFHRTSDPPSDSVSRPSRPATAELACAGASATPRTATSHSSLKLGPNRRLAPPACPYSAQRTCHCTDEAVLLTVRPRRLATVKRIRQHSREENLQSFRESPTGGRFFSWSQDALPLLRRRWSFLTPAGFARESRTLSRTLLPAPPHDRPCDSFR